MPLDPNPGRAPRRLAYRVPDRLEASDLAVRLKLALAGNDPSVEITPTSNGRTGSLGSAPSQVLVWEDAGDEVLVHLESLHVRVLPQALVIGVDLESDQTGRGPVVVRFVLGAVDDMAGLIASTDEVAHGNAMLAARWGSVFREVVWATLVGTVEEHAKERGLAPQALVAVDGQLRLRTTLDIPLAERLGKKPPDIVPGGGTPDREHGEPRLPPVRPPTRGTPR